MNNKQEQEVSEEEEKPQQPEQKLLGGVSACTYHQQTKVKEAVEELRAKNLAHIPALYDENIEKCFYQLVNGEKFQTILKINGEICRFFFVNTRGEFSFLEESLDESNDKVTLNDYLINPLLKDYESALDCRPKYNKKTVNQI